MSILTARTGSAFPVPAGATLRVTNTHGTQVVDTWALVPSTAGERLSMEHTRAALANLSPRTGDSLYSNVRRVIATIVQDTSPGVHDTLIAACDQARYTQLGHPDPHANCADNYRSALAAIDIPTVDVPCPWNLFMNVAVDADGALRFEAPRSRPGDAVTIRAEVDLVFVLSACPQDLVPVNGVAKAPTDVAVEIHA